MHQLCFMLAVALRDAHAVCQSHPVLEPPRCLIVRLLIHRGASLMNAYQRGAFCSNFTSFQTPLTSALAGFSSMQFGFASGQFNPLPML